jgi:hypothetical protein
MVIISATVCDKKGKILVARQFIEVSKLKMEEYISTFPKLIELGRNRHNNVLFNIMDSLSFPFFAK